jgi:hypothetical protein
MRENRYTETTYISTTVKICLRKERSFSVCLPGYKFHSRSGLFTCEILIIKFLCNVLKFFKFETNIFHVIYLCNFTERSASQKVKFSRPLKRIWRLLYVFHTFCIIMSVVIY